MTEKSERYETQPIEQVIVTIRGQRVILDADLASIYGVPTKRLNEQVRRNADRFPPDFAFGLTEQDVTNLKSQIATSSAGLNRSQFVTGSTHGGRRKPPKLLCGHATRNMVTRLTRGTRGQLKTWNDRTFWCMI